MKMKEITSRNGLYRFVISKETPMTKNEASQVLGTDTSGQLKGSTGYTYRLRYIYNGWISDVSLNNQEKATANIHITYRTESKYGQSTSIELETPTEYPEHVMNALVQRILTMHNGWDVPNISQTIPAMKQVLKDIGISGPESLQTPYDITWNDITYDRLLKNPHAISFKADGTRMLLVTSPIGTFFATSTLQIIPIFVPLIHKNIISDIHIIDGELMYSHGQSIYWAFDLIYSRDTNYISYVQRERHAILISLISVIGDIQPPMTLPLIPVIDVQESTSTISLRVKPLIIPETVDEFFYAISEMTRYPEELNIESDGLIISGVNQPYNANVFKWKPPSLLTVDFFIGPSMILNTFNRGTLYPHEEFTALSSDTPLSTLIGTVGEFQYINPTTWRFIRPRSDKGKPNSENVLNAILRLQRDPITLDVITGRSFSLMRKYHNRVKRAVYDLLQQSDISTLTDIGSGKGGDLSSWISKNMDVIAIEPDMNNIHGNNGLLSRVRQFDITEETSNTGYKRELILPNGTRESIPVTETVIQGECWSVTLFNVDADTYVEKILPQEEKTDALTLFNSATFLSPNTFCTLLNESIHDSGIIVLMVIDGKVLQREYLSTGSYSSPLLEIKSIPCNNTEGRGTRIRGIGIGSEQFGNLGCIYIRLNDSSTVGEGQEEGLVDIDVMLDILRLSGWIPDIDMYLTQEKLLGQEEARYSSTQRLLILRHAITSSTVVRKIYTPLLPGKTSPIQDSPWGYLIRVGTLGDKDTSFVHSLLEATDERYRSLDNISKTLLVSGKSNQIIRDILLRDIPIYIIPSNTWNMYLKVEDTVETYTHPSTQRVPGIVLMNNKDHWEPLIKRTIGEDYQYIW